MMQRLLGLSEKVSVLSEVEYQAPFLFYDTDTGEFDKSHFNRCLYTYTDGFLVTVKADQNGHHFADHIFQIIFLKLFSLLK